MAITITQGSIITNIRSTKYKGIRCYGVVISARCDIAQTKTDSIHIISAIPLSAWIQTAVFRKAVSSGIRTQIAKIEKWAETEGLDKDALISLGPQKVLLNIKAAQSSSQRAEALQACERWGKYITYNSGEVSVEEIAEFLNGEGKNTRINTLQSLFKGELTQYGFVPEAAYIKNGKDWDGLVVDYHDIIALTVEQVKGIQRRDFDYWKICETNQLNNANSQFFLEQPDDVVMIAYEIKSPWIEKIMQGFAFSFIRVGVDSISQDDAKRLSKQMLIHNDGQLIWKREGIS